MRRGEVWTVSGARDDAAKPRPAVIVQDDSFDATDSITICTESVSATMSMNALRHPFSAVISNYVLRTSDVQNPRNVFCRMDLEGVFRQPCRLLPPEASAYTGISSLAEVAELADAPA